MLNIPKVKIDSEALESYMIDFMVENLGKNSDVYEYLGLLMFRFGFKYNDVIELYGFNIDNREDYFLCRVNGVDDYKIRFLNVGNRKLHSKITLVKDNIGITYECFPLSLSELGARVIPVCEEIKYGDGISYIREYSREDAKYVINSGDYRFELVVVKPKNMELPIYDSLGMYSRYRLNNENLLIDNLLGCFLMWNIKDIVNVYKEICDISLGNDMSNYQEVSLKYFKNGEVTDIISLKNGELDIFGMTLPDMGRALFLNKDGTWNYKVNSYRDLFSYSINVMDDLVNYNILIRDCADTSLVSEIIQMDSIDVKENIENVKKLTKSMFDNR